MSPPPFGRIDLIGHGLITAILVAVACDQDREDGLLPGLKQRLAAIPAGLAVAIFHSHSVEYPHGPVSDTGIAAPPTRPQGE